MLSSAYTKIKKRYAVTIFTDGVWVDCHLQPKEYNVFKALIDAGELGLCRYDQETYDLSAYIHKLIKKTGLHITGVYHPHPKGRCKRYRLASKDLSKVRIITSYEPIT